MPAPDRHRDSVRTVPDPSSCPRFSGRDLCPDGVPDAPALSDGLFTYDECHLHRLPAGPGEVYLAGVGWHSLQYHRDHVTGDRRQALWYCHGGGGHAPGYSQPVVVHMAGFARGPFPVHACIRLARPRSEAGWPDDYPDHAGRRCQSIRPGGRKNAGFRPGGGEHICLEVWRPADAVPPGNICNGGDHGAVSHVFPVRCHQGLQRPAQRLCERSAGQHLPHSSDNCRPGRTVRSDCANPVRARGV